MRFSAMLTISAATITLAACGSEPSGEITTADGEAVEYEITESDGDADISLTTGDGEVTFTTGDAAGEGALPGGFTVMDGANVTARTIVDSDDEKGALIIFESSKSADEIVAFYKAEAEVAGIAIDADATMNGGRILSGKNAEGMRFSISTFPGDGMTTGQLTISQE